MLITTTTTTILKEAMPELRDDYIKSIAQEYEANNPNHQYLGSSKMETPESWVVTMSFLKMRDAANTPS